MTETSIGEREFDRLMVGLGLDARPDHVAVAVSGGCDSMALAMLAANWAARHGVGLTGLTVDHGLRPGSAEEAQRTSDWLSVMGVPRETLTWADDKPTSGIQAAAREARYRLMTEWCRRNGVRDLLLGHQLEDQAETVLMRLARGSGLDGLAAMEPVLEVGGIRLLRPLLTVPRGRLRATLRDAGQAWLEDPSNRDARFTRTTIGEALPLLGDQPATTTRIGNTARRLARARDALEHGTDGLLGRSATVDPAGFARVDAAALLAAPEELALRGLSRLLRCVGGRAGPVRLERLESLYAALGDGDATVVRTLQGCRVQLRTGEILICREDGRAQARMPFSAHRPVIWDGRFELSAGLCRGAKPPAGLRVGRLGADGWRLVAEARPESLRSGLPAVVRRSLPTLWCGDKVIANPHLGFFGEEAGPWLASLEVNFRAGRVWNTDELSMGVILNSPLS